MPRYPADEHLPYFCTIAVLDWLPVLVEARYMDPIIDSLRFSRQRAELGLRQDGFHPVALESRPVFEQKLRYLHENPLHKGLIRRPDDCWYSSAASYNGRKDVCLEVDLLEF